MFATELLSKTFAQPMIVVVVILQGVVWALPMLFHTNFIVLTALAQDEEQSILHDWPNICMGWI